MPLPIMFNKLIPILLFALAMTGYAHGMQPVPPENNQIFCPQERPQVCTFIYQPVCAVRDTGIRCVTTPCPSTELKTYGNACTACSDPKVAAYTVGECPIKEKGQREKE